MAERKKYYLDTWDSCAGVWVNEWSGYQYGDMRKMHIKLEKEGYDIEMRYEVPSILDKEKND